MGTHAHPLTHPHTHILIYIIYIYVYMYICKCIYIYTYTYIYIHTYTNIYIYIYKHLCICIYTYTLRYILIYTYTYIYIYLYIHILVYIHLCIHTYENIHWPPSPSQVNTHSSRKKVILSCQCLTPFQGFEINVYIHSLIVQGHLGMSPEWARIDDLVLDCGSQGSSCWTYNPRPWLLFAAVLTMDLSYPRFRWISVLLMVVKPWNTI